MYLNWSQGLSMKYVLLNAKERRLLVISSASSFLWFTIMTLQEHKEERFMFVAYPSICVSAALVLRAASKIMSKTVIKQNYVDAMELVTITFIVLLSILLSVSRIMALVTSYRAPIEIFKIVSKLDATNGAICMGSEWYRFPSNFFVPSPLRVNFIESGFGGQLPGQFLNESSREAFFHWGKSISSERCDFNDENLIEVSHLVSYKLFKI